MNVISIKKGMFNTFIKKRVFRVMKKLSFLMMAALALVALSCSEDNGYEPVMPDGSGGGDMGGGSATTGVSASIGDLTSFTIDVDSTSLDESESVPADDEDYIENNTFDSEIAIHYSGSSATVTGSVSGVTVTTDGAHVTVLSTVKGVRYTLSGTTSDGSFKLYGEKKYSIRLNGVSITNSTGAAINSQCGKRGYIVLVDGTTNVLRDGTTYTVPDGEDMKATLFSEGELLFSGTGHLQVYANCKGGITSDDYILLRPGVNIYVRNTAGNGIKANDGITMLGGVVNVECSAAAAKGLKSESDITIDGGRLTAITTGTGEWDSDDNDVSGSAGIKCDSVLTINGGEVYCKSTGTGGKGISVDEAMLVNGGTVKVITTGTVYSYGRYSTSPKGIRCDKNITVSDGHIMVRTTGGENSEGIESKSQLAISGGQVEVYAYDDAINASSNITISGGSVFTYGINNDGIDSNGTLTLTGGTVVACGTTSPEEGFDCDQNTFTITGGTILGIGGTTSTPTSSVTTQPVAIVGGSGLSSGSYLAVAGNDGSNIFAFNVPRTYSSYTVLVSSPSLTKGGKCTLTTGATVSGGTSFDGLVTGATVSGGTTLASLTLSDIVTKYNFTNSQGGGAGGWR